MPGRSRRNAPNQQTRDDARTPGLDVRTNDVSNAVQVQQLDQFDDQRAAAAVHDNDYFKHPYWPTFRDRMGMLLEKLPAGLDQTGVMSAARDAWQKLCDATWNSGNNMAEAKRQGGDGNVPLTSPNFLAAMESFNSLVGDLTAYSASQFHQSSSFGFWSKSEGKQLAENSCDLTLETSAMGSLMDGLPSIDHKHMSWDLQLWGALSRAYAEAVASEVRGGTKTVHVCMGAGSDDSNIWGSIESAAMRAGLQGTGLALSDIATYHAAAPVSLEDRSLDTSVRGGEFPGTLYSGDDIKAARKAADDHWATLELGKHPYLEIGREAQDAELTDEELENHPYLEIGRAAQDDLENHPYLAISKEGR